MREASSVAGTAIEAEALADIKDTFDKIVQPVLSGKSDAWSGEWASFEKFQLMSGLVQSRTFHLEENNWLTGATSQGTSRTVQGHAVKIFGTCSKLDSAEAV